MAQLLKLALSENPKLLPEHTEAVGVLNSHHIDDITYAVWQVAHRSHNGNGYILWKAAEHSSLFSDRKLRALAALNFLPSWWYFRENVLEDFGRMKAWFVDDSISQAQFQNALKQAANMMEEWHRGALKRADQGAQ